MTNQSEWVGAVGSNWARMADATDRCLGELTEHFEAVLATICASAVLDIGCGAGELAIAQTRTRAGAYIIGLDISADMLVVAQRRAEGVDRLSFVLADASTWTKSGFTPDLLISRHGLMFFADPPEAFAHLARHAAPKARLVFSCFRSPILNPWASDIAPLFDRPASPQAKGVYSPGPFAFADPDLVRTILENSGWKDVAFDEVNFRFVVGEGKSCLDDALHLFSHIGPSASLLRNLPESEREAASKKLIGWLQDHREDDLITFPASAWLVKAQKHG